MFAVVLLGAGCGLAQVRTDVRVLEFLGRHSETRSTVELFDRVYGGVNVLTLEADSGGAGGVNGAEFLRYLSAVAEHAQNQPEVTAVYSYDQVMAMANEIWEGGAPGSFRLPDDPRLVAVFAATLGGFDLPLLETLVDAEFRTATWIVRTPDLPSKHYLEVVDRIIGQAEAMQPDGVSLSAARGTHAILESDRRILSSQLWSGVGSLAAIGLVLWVLWRSLKLAALALGATSVPVAVAMAGLGYGGMPLNSITVMVGAVCLGIAVDHSVHFLTHWREGLRHGLSQDQALAHTLEQKSGPVTVSTLVLAGVFSLMLTCSFPPVAAFGGLAASAFLMTWFTVLVGVPRWLVGRQSS
jgi:predicted RND superfamily exporter protein